MGRRLMLVWDPSSYSYTWYMHDLVSWGETIFGTTRVVFYSGGNLTIYVDGLPSNHDYGIDPPNATVPSTFQDGISSYLEGYFLTFTLIYNSVTRSGSFCGQLRFTGGDVYDLLDGDDTWTFGSNTGGLSQRGYDLELDGDVYHPVISVEEETWGGIKSLYR